MDPLPAAEWCTCDPKKEVEGKSYPPKQGEGKAAKLTGVGGTPDT